MLDLSHERDVAGWTRPGHGRPRGRTAGARPGSVHPFEHRREAPTTPCARRFQLPSDRTAGLSAPVACYGKCMQIGPNSDETAKLLPISTELNAMGWNNPMPPS